MVGHFVPSLPCNNNNNNNNSNNNNNNNNLVFFLFLWKETFLNCEKLFQMVGLKWSENKVVCIGTSKLSGKSIGCTQIL